MTAGHRTRFFGWTLIELIDTPAMSHAATNNPIAEDRRKIAVRRRKTDHGSERIRTSEASEASEASGGEAGILSQVCVW